MRQQPSPANLLALAKALEVSADYLLDRYAVPRRRAMLLSDLMTISAQLPDKALQRLIAAAQRSVKSSAQR